MNHCKDCKYWKQLPDSIKWGECTHPKVATGNFNRKYEGLAPVPLKHSNLRYRTNKACQTRFVAIGEEEPKPVKNEMDFF